MAERMLFSQAESVARPKSSGFIDEILMDTGDLLRALVDPLDMFQKSRKGAIW